MKQTLDNIFSSTRAMFALFLALLLSAVSLLTLPGIGKAAELDTESTSLSDPRTSATGVTYTLTVGNVSASNIKCIETTFTTAVGGSTLPTGMVITPAVITPSGTLQTGGTWTESNPNAYTYRIVDAGAGSTPAGGDGFTLVLAGITNSSDPAGTTYYTEINTFSDAACTTAVDSNGIAAFSLTDGVTITASVDPTLDFDVTDSTCDLGTLPTTGTHKGCDIDFDIQTNAANGWTISAMGESAGTDETLYNSAEGTEIAASTTAESLGTIGAEEDFGFNLVDSNTTTPDAGTAVSGSGTIAGDYTTVNTIHWPGGTFDTIISHTGASDTSATVLVAANRSATTPAGNYSTTLILRAVANY